MTKDSKKKEPDMPAPQKMIACLACFGDRWSY
jgi:hypothetical protein